MDQVGEEDKMPTSGSTQRPNLDVYKMLAEAERDDEWVEYMKNEIGNGSAINIALLLKEDLETIQSLYESNPNYLDWDTLKLACRFGVKKGVLPFLAEKKPEFINADILCGLAWKLDPTRHADDTCNTGDISILARLKPGVVSITDNFGTYPIAAAMESSVAESDVKTLVELWPECVLLPMKFGQWGPGNKVTPLQNCLEKGYSSELLEFMIEKLPETIDNFVLSSTREEPIKARDLMWIKHIFQRCHANLHCSNLRWAGPSFHDFLGICFFQIQNTKELHLTVPTPSSIDSSDDAIDQAELSMQQFNHTYSAQEHLEHPNIEKLTLGFSHHAYCELLGLLPYWPHLHDLTVDVSNHLDPSIPALCHLLQQEKLKRLTLLAAPEAVASKKRKKPSEEVYLPLKKIFDVLATNKTLKYLKVTPLQATGEEHCDLLLEALKQNTTLEDISGFWATQKLSCTQLLIDHYLKSNRCGRKMAQDDSTTLKDFVGLLECTQTKLNFYGGSMRFPDHPYWRPNDWLSTMYGLLRAGINKWTK